MLTQTTSRVLEPSDLDAALAVLDREPVTNAFVTSRVQVAGLDPWRLGGEMWGWYEDGMLTSLCYAGANLVPICATPRAVRAFADRARRAGRRCSSIVGPAEATAQLWRLLEPSWGPAREVRARQPLMVADRMPTDIAADPYVRRIRKDEMDTIMPACVAMFTEEVGVSPLARRRRPPLPGPRGRTRRRGTLVRASRRAGQGRLQGGDRCGDLQGLSDPGRVGGPEYRGEAWRPPRWQRYSVTPWRTWPPWSAST